MNPEHAAESSEGLWDAQDVARYLKASRSWVYQKAEAGLLPSLRIGGLLRLDPAAVRAWVQGTVPPHSPPRRPPLSSDDACYTISDMQRDAMMAVRLPAEVKEAVKRAAEDDHGRSLSGMVVRILREWCVEKGYLQAEANGEAPKRRGKKG